MRGQEIREALRSPLDRPAAAAAPYTGDGVGGVGPGKSGLAAGWPAAGKEEDLRLDLSPKKRWGKFES
jgi:hypothetical protein